MQRLFFKRLPVMPCIVALLLFSCLVFSPVTFAQTAATTLTVNQVWTADGSNNAKTSLITTPQASYNQTWSGYVVQGKKANQVVYTNVKGSWIVPVADCSKVKTSRSAIWVGLSGFDIRNPKTSIEQIGTTADCNNGVPNYYAWYQMYPDPPVRLDTVYAGDSIDTRVTLTDQNYGVFDLRMVNNTQIWTDVATGYRKGAQLSSAEWIVEDPNDSACSTSTRVCPLTEFGTNYGSFFAKDTIHFSACSANGNPITANPVLWRFVITDNGQAGGQLKAFPLNLYDTDSTFNVSWVHS